MGSELLLREVGAIGWKVANCYGGVKYGAGLRRDGVHAIERRYLASLLVNVLAIDIFLRSGCVLFVDVL